MKMSMEEGGRAPLHPMLFAHKKAVAIASSLFRVGAFVLWSEHTERQKDGAVMLETTVPAMQKCMGWGTPPNTVNW